AGPACNAGTLGREAGPTPDQSPGPPAQGASAPHAPRAAPRPSALRIPACPGTRQGPWRAQALGASVQDAVRRAADSPAPPASAGGRPKAAGTAAATYQAAGPAPRACAEDPRNGGPGPPGSGTCLPTAYPQGVPAAAVPPHPCPGVPYRGRPAAVGPQSPGPGPAES